MIIYFAIYIILFILGIHYYGRTAKYELYLVGIFLMLFTGLRGTEVDSDFGTYTGYFEVIRQSTLSEAMLIVEPSFVFLSYLLPDIRFVMITYAMLSVSIKVNAIIRISPLPFLSVALWFSHFFLVHEMNQVRAGVAIGLLLFSIPYIINRSLIKFLLIVAVAVFFHYSAVVFIPIYFIGHQKVEKYYYFLIPVSYALYMVGIGLMELMAMVNISFLQSKIEAYNMLHDAGTYTKMNVFNPAVMLRIGLIYLFLFNAEKFNARSKYFNILLKMYIFSIALMVLFASLPAFALRIADVFGIVEIILVPFLLYLLDNKYVSLIIVFFFGLLFMSLDLLYNHFLSGYSI